MEKELLIKSISTHKSIRKIASEANKSYTTIRYWLKVYDLTTRIVINSCIKCGEADDSKFYQKKRKSMCKLCFNQYCIRRWIRLKIKAIQYLGGKCNNCGFKTQHYSVYDFHHKSGTDKQMNWSKMKKHKWSEMKQELDKCELLCANCHRIEHEDKNNHSYHKSPSTESNCV